MTREELESIYWLKKELNMWEKKLEEYNAELKPSAKAIDGMPFSNTNLNSNPTERLAIYIADATEIIQSKKIEIEWTIRNAERYIMSVDNSEMRMILEYRCIQNKDWEEIGDELGYHRTTVSDKYRKFMDKNFSQIS